MDNLFNVSGRVAVVTGAASGLGRAVALGLAKAGAKVSLADVSEAGLEHVAAMGRTAGHAVLARRVDVTQLADLQALRSAALSTWGRVDVLINAAGITHRAPAETFPVEDWERILAVNLTGTFLSCQVFGQTMLAQGKGSIVNFASIGGLVGLPQSVAYCASKGGVVQLTKVLAIEWAPKGVRVNAVAPSAFDTPMVQRVLESDPTYRGAIGAAAPIGRLGQPHEIVGAALFLASDASSMVTGHVLSVDGGYVAR